MSTTVIILAAGKGTRMRSTSKVLQPLAGRPLLGHVIKLQKNSMPVILLPFMGMAVIELNNICPRTD
jgi:bifunctional UDP-N-acetylglucosamine pyrophosphorylase/glucosamine-1-phosphate N-acetyltransferase